jgi:hypothetical protein
MLPPGGMFRPDDEGEESTEEFLYRSSFFSFKKLSSYFA